MKRMHVQFTIIILTILLVLSGCSGFNTHASMLTPTSTSTPAPTFTVTTTPSPTSTPTPTPIPTSTPTPTPAPTPTPTLSPEEEMQVILNLAPEISGLSKKIQDDTVTYIAQAGNKYGLETGKYAGVYKEEVYELNENDSIENSDGTFSAEEKNKFALEKGLYSGIYKDQVNNATKTGAVALVAPVVEVLLEEQIPTSKNGYLMPLAADLSDSDLSKTDKVYISIDAKDTILDPDLPYLVDTDCGGEDIDIANIIPGKTKMVQSSNPELDLWTNESQLNWDANKTDYNNQMAFLTIYTTGQKNQMESVEPTDFGTRIGTTDQRILQNMGCSGGSTLDFESFDNVLNVNGKPVSLIVNKSD